jgi:uncharacterized membrane protein YcfT
MRLSGTTVTASDAHPILNNQPGLFFTADGRVDWVDVGKGICIFLVVMMHSTLGVQAAAGDTSWMGLVVEWAQPFRIPAFFLIAGLFLVKTIDAPWQRYLDRKVVHFAYFYLLWLVIQCSIKCGILDGNLDQVLPNMLEALYQPYGTLWFIYMLPIFFLVTRMTRAIPIWAMLVVGALLESAPISTGLLIIDEFAARFVYFYAGYALARYAFAFADKVSTRPTLSLAGLLVWAAFAAAMAFNTVTVSGQSYALAQLPVVSLATGALGAFAIIAAAVLLGRSFVGPAIRYLGSHSIIIYLAFFLPMAITREVGLRLGVFPDTGTLALVTTLVAVATPLAGYWIIQKIGFGRFLFERPNWASLDRAVRGNESAGKVSIAPAE